VENRRRVVNPHSLAARLAVVVVALGTVGALLMGLGPALSDPAALVTVALTVGVVVATALAGIRAAVVTTTRYW